MMTVTATLISRIIFLHIKIALSLLSFFVLVGFTGGNYKPHGYQLHSDATTCFRSLNRLAKLQSVRLLFGIHFRIFSCTDKPLVSSCPWQEIRLWHSFPFQHSLSSDYARPRLTFAVSMATNHLIPVIKAKCV